MLMSMYRCGRIGPRMVGDSRSDRVDCGRTVNYQYEFDMILEKTPTGSIKTKHGRVVFLVRP